MHSIGVCCRMSSGGRKTSILDKPLSKTKAEVMLCVKADVLWGLVTCEISMFIQPSLIYIVLVLLNIIGVVIFSLFYSLIESFCVDFNGILIVLFLFI